MKRNFIWQDLTVKNAEEIKDFYENVFGWISHEHPMEDYVDYDMIDPKTNQVIAGICHKRDDNANIPSMWLNYMEVNSVKKTLEICLKNNGKVLDGPRKMGQGWFAVIQDPAGACMAIISQKN